MIDWFERWTEAPAAASVEVMRALRMDPKVPARRLRDELDYQLTKLKLDAGRRHAQ